MKSSARRARVLVLGVMAVLVAAMLVVPALAMATTGDAWDNPVVLPALPWSAPQVGTLLPKSKGSDTWADLYNRVHLNKGETVKFTLTTGASAGHSDMIFDSVSINGAYLPWSDHVTNSVHTLSGVAPVTGDYIVWVYGEAVGNYTLEATITPAAAFKVSPLTAPKKAKKKKAFTVSVNLNPHYNGLTAPFRFEIQRKVGKKWKTYSTVGTSKISDVRYYTKFIGSIKITKSGTFRVRGKFSDAAHPVAKYTAWKTVTVK